jgi:hypothetical protein
MICLTDMWKAAGKRREQAPNFWLHQSDTKAFMDEFKKKSNATENCISTRRGQTGGTWAHWQIAVAPWGGDPPGTPHAESLVLYIPNTHRNPNKKDAA